MVLSTGFRAQQATALELVVLLAHTALHCYSHGIPIPRGYIKDSKQGLLLALARILERLFHPIRNVGIQLADVILATVAIDDVTHEGIVFADRTVAHRHDEIARTRNLDLLTRERIGGLALDSHAGSAYRNSAVFGTTFRASHLLLTEGTEVTPHVTDKVGIDQLGGLLEVVHPMQHLTESELSHGLLTHGQRE